MISVTHDSGLGLRVIGLWSSEECLLRTMRGLEDLGFWRCAGSSWILVSCCLLREMVTWEITETTSYRNWQSSLATNNLILLKAIWIFATSK